MTKKKKIYHYPYNHCHHTNVNLLLIFHYHNDISIKYWKLLKQLKNKTNHVLLGHFLKLCITTVYVQDPNYQTHMGFYSWLARGASR